MKSLNSILAVFLFAATAFGCQSSAPLPSPTLPPATLPVSSPTGLSIQATLTPPTSEPTSTPTALPLPAGSPSPTEVFLPDEAIMILEPASGSRVVSPVRISGIADSTFEQVLVVRMLRDDGTEIAFQPTMIQSEMGQRGSFELEIEFEVTGDRQAFIQVFADSPRDGGITHLSAVGITLSETGPAQIRRVEPRPEQVTLFQPAIRERIQGGVAFVQGYGLASFEQTLLIQVQDENGNVAGEMPVIVEAPDLGQPGPFSAEVPYQVANEGPGRIVVRDISPAFGGDVHLSSVEISLAP